MDIVSRYFSRFRFKFKVQVWSWRQWFTQGQITNHTATNLDTHVYKHLKPENTGDKKWHLHKNNNRKRVKNTKTEKQIWKNTSTLRDLEHKRDCRYLCNLCLCFSGFAVCGCIIFWHLCFLVSSVYVCVWAGLLLCRL
jgi:hypothetical protein